jgi:hypothetical protein
LVGTSDASYLKNCNFPFHLGQAFKIPTRLMSSPFEFVSSNVDADT